MKNYNNNKFIVHFFFIVGEGFTFLRYPQNGSIPLAGKSPAARFGKKRICKECKNTLNIFEQNYFTVKGGRYERD